MWSDSLGVFSVVGGLLGIGAALGGMVGLWRFVEHRRYLRDIDATDPVTAHRPPVRSHRRFRLVWGGGRHVG